MLQQPPATRATASCAAHMTRASRYAKSYIVGGWQWWRHSEGWWENECGYYVFDTDGGWWLMGNGVERHLIDRSGGVKRALAIATTDHADVLRRGRISE